MPLFRAIRATSTDPSEYFALGAGEFDPVQVQDATPSQDGKMTAAQATSLAAIPATVTAEATARATADTNEANARIAGDAAVAATVTTETNARIAADAAHAGSPSGHAVATRAASGFMPTTSVDQLASAEQPFAIDEACPYKPLHWSGSKIAGATLRPNQTGSVNGAVQNGQVVHDANTLHPFQVLCPTDFYGYPHHLFKQMNGQSVANSQVSRGWESGQRFRKGDLLRRPGRGFRYEYDLRLTNVAWLDAFVEFVLEPNPAVAQYAGANRIRFPSGELGVLAASGSPIPMRFWCEVLFARAQSYSWRAGLEVYAAGGGLLFDLPFSGFTDAGFDSIVNDARWQLRWRVDRIAKLNAYDDANQGSNQGANLLRAELRHARMIPIGFDDSRRI